MDVSTPNIQAVTFAGTRTVRTFLPADERPG
jgi:hypothetical protein